MGRLRVWRDKVPLVSQTETPTALLLGSANAALRTERLVTMLDFAFVGMTCPGFGSRRRGRARSSVDKRGSRVVRLVRGGSRALCVRYIEDERRGEGRLRASVIDASTRTCALPVEVFGDGSEHMGSVGSPRSLPRRVG